MKLKLYNEETAGKELTVFLKIDSRSRDVINISLVDRDGRDLPATNILQILVDKDSGKVVFRRVGSVLNEYVDVDGEVGGKITEVF